MFWYVIDSLINVFQISQFLILSMLRQYGNPKKFKGKMIWQDNIIILGFGFSPPFKGGEDRVRMIKWFK
jgi:hypothetical protein